MINDKRVKKKKTESRKTTVNPVWNQALTFTVPSPKLHSCTLEVSATYIIIWLYCMLLFLSTYIYWTWWMLYKTVLHTEADVRGVEPALLVVTISLTSNIIDCIIERNWYCLRIDGVILSNYVTAETTPSSLMPIMKEFNNFPPSTLLITYTQGSLNFCVNFHGQWIGVFGFKPWPFPNASCDQHWPKKSPKWITDQEISKKKKVDCQLIKV